MFRVALLATFAFALCSCWGDGSSAPAVSPTPEATATAEVILEATTPPATATPDYGDFFEAIDLRAADPVPLPPGVVLYARDGTWEGAGGDFTRYYRDASGTVRTDDLIVSTFGPDARAFVETVVDERGAFWATVCHGICYGQPDPVTIRHSEDGGITWRDVVTFENGGWGTIIAASQGSLTLRGAGTADFNSLWSYRPGEEPRRIPLPADVPAFAPLYAAHTSDGLLIAAQMNGERTRLRHLLNGGQMAEFQVPNPFQQVDGGGFVPGSGGERFFVSWYGPGAAPDWDIYFGMLDPATSTFARIGGDAGGEVIRTNVRDGVGHILNVHWFSPTEAIVRAEFDAADYLPGQAPFFRTVPAVLDIEAATVSPIEEFVPLLAGKSGGPVPVAVLEGEFARVGTGGSCLNVRPSPEEPPFGCFADDVLVRLLGSESRYNGTLWLAVAAPDGRHGWAAAEFLEP